MTDHSRPTHATYRTGPATATAGGVPATARAAGLGGRLVAYLVDILILTGIFVLLWVAILVLGILTLTLGWWLWTLLFPPLIGIAYSALTVGGPAQATIGMRMLGFKVVDAGTGGPVDKVTAAVHALLFYIGAGTFLLWVIDVLIGLARDDRRLGHDLLVGVTLVRR
jgi:uncharacterized RDD family membrane protein YckC